MFPVDAEDAEVMKTYCSAVPGRILSQQHHEYMKELQAEQSQVESGLWSGCAS